METMNGRMTHAVAQCYEGGPHAVGALDADRIIGGDTTGLVAALDRLKRFISPVLADLIVRGDDEALASQRREVSVVFLDLRGFTRFAESEAPEDVMFVLNGYHRIVGQLVADHRGILERFTGDGMMVYFNGPIRVPDPELRAVSLALAAHDRLATLAHEWQARGAALSLGVGISYGFATVGRIGFEGRYDYAAIGAVTNLAARLCARARPGETLVCQRVMSAVRDLVEAEQINELHFRGFRRPHTVFSVKAFKAGRGGWS